MELLIGVNIEHSKNRKVFMLMVAILTIPLGVATNEWVAISLVALALIVLIVVFRKRDQALQKRESGRN
jgi:phosphatidylglycerophosphate synthase